MQSRFMCGEYAQARESGEKAAEVIWASVSHIQLLDFHLYRALTLAACYPAAPPEEQQRYLEAMRQHQQQLAEWANHCPENFRAIVQLQQTHARSTVLIEECDLPSLVEDALRLQMPALQRHGIIVTDGPGQGATAMLELPLASL